MNASKTEQALAINNVYTQALEFNGQKTEFYGVTDGQRLFGVVSSMYKPVSYAKLVANVREHMPESEIVNTYAEASLRRVVFNIRLPKVYELNGEGVETFINLRNSLDGSWPIGIIVSPVNVVCRNTYILSLKQAYINVSKKHTAGGVSDFFMEIPKVTRIYEALEGQLQTAEALLKMPATTALGREFIQKLMDKKLIGQKTGEKIQAHLVRPQFTNEEPSSMMGVFNAATNVLTREVEEKTSLTSFDKLSDVGEAFAELVSVR